MGFGSRMTFFGGERYLEDAMAMQIDSASSAFVIHVHVLCFSFFLYTPRTQREHNENEIDT